MTLSPGEAWGRAERLPADAPIVAGDAELVALLGDRAGATPASELPIVGLAGGDLCTSLGGRGDVAERRGSLTTVALIDLGRLVTDTAEHVFAAHVFAHGLLWSGEGAAIMNAERCGDWLVAPRAHPGDGLLDIVHGRLGGRERLVARSRVRSGDHLPHPLLKVRRVDRLELGFDRPRRLWVDGRRRGRIRHLSVDIVPGAVRVAV